jgi:NADH-quinone oxidoreductase subunit G
VAVITIDGKPYTVEAGKNLLEVCLSLGLDLPYFCWHPALGSVGACRQCAAKQFADEQDQRGRLITACMTPVADGQIFSIHHTQAKQFRATVIESLMTNHPHDCPVCEEGGECHLQDMTEMSDHTLRRYRGKKRTHNNQYLGPLINHEMNRCISCYRCVRFYRDYAGGQDLAALGSHHHVYFGRERDGVLESEFAGNLVEVCPTGVFTDKPFSANYTRKWDLQTAPSVCGHCAVGCNVTPGARYGQVRRVSNRYHSKINGYFLCDRGRFGYGFNHHADRIMPKHSGNGSVDRQSNGVAALQQAVQQARAGDAIVLGVGSGRASLENNFALREFVGSQYFYAGISLTDYESQRLLAEQLVAGSLHLANMQQIEQADAVVILGEDIAETAPRISLALRQASRNQGKEACADVGIEFWQDAAVRRFTGETKTPLFIASLTSTRLDDIATLRVNADPRIIAQIGFYIADLLEGKNSEVNLRDEHRRWANGVVDTLKSAQRPLIITGAGYQQLDLLRASLSLYAAVKRRDNLAKFYYALPECNSLGLSLLLNSNAGVSGLTHPSHPVSKSRSLQDLLDELRRVEKQKKRRVLIVMENDLYRTGEKSNVDELLREVDELIVLDHCTSETTARANSILPVSTIMESQGTLVSAEGRAQRYYSVIASGEGILPSWRLIRDGVQRAVANTTTPCPSNWHTIAAWQRSDDVCDSIAGRFSSLAKIVKLNTLDQMPLSRQSHRYSGRTAMDANVSVASKRPNQDPDSPFTYSMEGQASHGPLENSTWSPGWNSNQAIHKFQQEVAGPLRGGESGVCLFDIDGDAKVSRSHARHDNLEEVSSAMLAYPLHHVFGSEELSAKSPSIAELAPAPCVLINPKSVALLHLKEWDTVICSTVHLSRRLYIRFDSHIPKGLAGVLQMDGCLSNHWPVAVTLVKDKTAMPRPVELIATDTEARHVY